MSKERMMELLRELMNNSKRSDRDLAKILGMSQPTVTRTRKKLERTGYVQEYTVIPDLPKLGYEIMAFTFMNIIRYDEKTGEPFRKLSETAHKWALENPKIILGAAGDGLDGKNCMMLSLHRDYTDYYQFISEFRGKWSGYLRDIESFLVSLKATMVKPLSFRYLEIKSASADD
ncbi:MAG: winged helix-turn-helix transcriptional regulator [Candidatus Bathyarchaeota archaeon]|jgi:DNA-binding Lrp family transcriptional regulator